MANYPASLDVLVNPSSGTLTTDPTYPHATRQHTDLNDILEALEAKLGIGVSTPATANRLLAADASSVTSFRQLDSPDIGPAAFESLATDNIVLNGDFSIWQRGTSFPVTNNYVADRWVLAGTSAAVVSCTRSAGSPVPAVGTPLSPYYARAQVSTADAAVAAGDSTMVYTEIEGYLWARVAQRQFTISFWVRATRIGKHCIAVLAGNASLSYVAEYTVNVTNTWEYKTVTISASPSTLPSGTWNYENLRGIFLQFVLQAGTTYLAGSANTWIAGDFKATAGVVNDCDTVGNIFDLAQVKITPGAVAAPFVARPFQQELALCQRYYTKTFPYATAPAAGIGSAAGALMYYVIVGGSGHYMKVNWRFPVVMRATPTITSYNPVLANANWRNLSAGIDSGAGNPIDVSDRFVLMRGSETASDVATHNMGIHATASAEIP